MILIHREELATQAKAKILEWNPTLRVGIEMADSYASDNDDVVVASVPTIGRDDSKRLLRFKRDEFGLIKVDEAHHSTAASYKNVFSHFGVDAPDSNKLLIGVTATPNRADKQGLGQIFDEIAYQYTILEAINEGYLVNLRGYKISTRTNLDSLSVISDSIRDDSSLSTTINTPARNKQIVDNWKQLARTRQTVAFCASVQHSKDLAYEFNKQGIKAAAIWANDPDRQQKLKAHREGRLQVLTNCGILTEGYDDWRISCIIMARPTKSTLLFTQMVGRGTRIPAGIDDLLSALKRGDSLSKTDCIVIDVCDVSSRHSLVSLASLFGLAPKADLNGKTITEALTIVDDVRKVRPEIILDELQNIDQLTTSEIDLFKDKTLPEIADNTKLKWTKTKENEYRILLPMGEEVKVYKDILDKWEVKGVVTGKGFMQQGLNSLPEAFRVADQFITTFGRGLLNILRQVPNPVKSAPKKLSPLASTPQKNFIRSLYKDNAHVLANLDKYTANEARRLISTFGARK